MQVRQLSLPVYVPAQLGHRAEGVDALLPSGDKPPRQDVVARSAEIRRVLPTVAEYEQGRQRYSVTRVEAAPGRTAQALQLYADVESGAERESIKVQLGMYIVV